MSADANEIVTDKGIRISSSEPITPEEKAFLVKPIPPDAKPGEKKAEAPKSKIQVESVDETGKSHNEKGQFKGNGKPAEEPEPAKVEAKPEKDDNTVTKVDKASATERVTTAMRLKKEAEDARTAAEQRAYAAEKRAAELEAKSKPPEIKPVDAKAEPEKKTGKPRLEDYSERSWQEYEEDRDKWLLDEGKRIAREEYESREKTRANAQHEQQRRAEYTKNADAAGKAIEEAGGDEFLAKVAPTMERLAKASEQWRDTGENSPLKQLAEFVLHCGAKAPMVMEYLHDNTEIVDTFEKIGLLPESRQAYEIHGQMGILVGTLRALDKVKAHATTGNPEPAASTFKPRANPPVPPVTGSPHIAEPERSNMTFEQHMASKGLRPRKVS